MRSLKDKSQGAAASPGPAGASHGREVTGPNPTSGGRISHLGARESADWETPGDLRCPCSHPWILRTGPCRSPRQRAAFVPSAQPPWRGQEGWGRSMQTRCPSPQGQGHPDPQPKSYLLSSSSVSPESSAPLSCPSANGSLVNARPMPSPLGRLVTFPPSLMPEHRCRHSNPQAQWPSKSS